MDISINDLPAESVVEAPAEWSASTENRTVATPKRLPNRALRAREHLTPDEVKKLIAAARSAGRYGERDGAAILLAFRHGLRNSELCGLRWDAIDLKARTLATQRAKGGASGVHPLQADEVKALATLAAQRAPQSIYVFANERGGALAPGAIRKLVKRAGQLAKLGIDCHPHMLRHSAGYALADKGKDTRLIQEWLGHRSIQSTVRYTALSPKRFEKLWE